MAALRGRLIDPIALRKLADADSAGAFLAALERMEDWRPVLRETEALFGEPQAAVEAAIERHRSARLSALVGWYGGSARRLVEALVLPLDAERVVAIVRRRSGGASASAVGTSIVGGALLDVAALGVLSRASTLTGLMAGLATAGLLPASEAHGLVVGVEARRGQRWLEDGLIGAFDRAREARAAGRGANPRLVQALLASERSERAMVARELLEVGPGTAWITERAASLARLDRTASLGPRDPLGIGAVAGYVAAVEAQAIRLRAALTRIVAGWGPETVVAYLARAGG